MPQLDQDLRARYGREPLALALEHIERFPMRAQSETATKEQATERARAMVLAAAGKRANAAEFVFTGFTCGYFKTADGLAIIPVWGDVGPARYFWPWVWYEDLAAAADAAAKDGDVKAILYHKDSPGGYVTGVAECAAAIEAAAALKPSASYVNDLSASADYWLSCASGVISGPATAIVNSIGALCIHDDCSRMLDEMGLTISIIRSAARKAETNPFEPLSAAARQQLQQEVTVCADQFIGEVARLRAIDELVVRGTQAACSTIAPAIAAGFADRMETFDQACAAVLARAVAPAPAPVQPAVKAKAKSRAGKAAQTKPTHPRASAKPGVSAVARTAAKRSQTMDPTTLPPEEQIARYDEIAAIIAEEPADDNAKIGQFVQICGIVNRDAEEAPAEEPADPAEEPAEPAAKAKVNAHASAIAASKEGKANPAGAMEAIAAGLTLTQFKAIAPSLGKGKGLGARMSEQESAARLAPDATARATQANVAALNPTNIFAKRREAAAGGKK